MFRKKYRKYLVLLLVIVIFITLACIQRAISRQTLEQNVIKLPRIRSLNIVDNNRKPLIVLGILTVDRNVGLRTAQRGTWISRMKTLQERLPFRFVYKYWFDTPTNESIRENNLYGDIEFLNVTSHGRVVRFGEKIYVWMKYIRTRYPEAMMGIRLDDDVFVCVPQVFQKLDRIKSGKLYYGHAKNSTQKLQWAEHVDEMFFATGHILMERIASREYCNMSYHRCDESRQLKDYAYGDKSLTVWLSIYDDVYFHPANNEVIHRLRSWKGNRSDDITQDFCEKYLLHHKSTSEFMEKLMFMF